MIARASERQVAFIRHNKVVCHKRPPTLKEQLEGGEHDQTNGHHKSEVKGDVSGQEVEQN